jgi:hypothetical protein
LFYTLHKEGSTQHIAKSIGTYKTTTFLSEHSTPNQSQGSTETSSSTQFDKAPKGSLIILCFNFKRLLPAQRNHILASIAKYIIKIQQDSSFSTTFFIQRIAAKTQVKKQEAHSKKAQSSRKILVLGHSCMFLFLLQETSLKVRIWLSPTKKTSL